MSDIQQRYLMISYDLQPNGYNTQAWISIDRPTAHELISYPNIYTYMGDMCTWFIYSAGQLTPKMISAAGEQADRICIEGRKILNNRVAVNRK